MSNLREVTGGTRSVLPVDTASPTDEDNALNRFATKDTVLLPVDTAAPTDENHALGHFATKDAVLPVDTAAPTDEDHPLDHFATEDTVLQVDTAAPTDEDRALDHFATEDTVLPVDTAAPMDEDRARDHFVTEDKGNIPPPAYAKRHALFAITLILIIIAVVLAVVFVPRARASAPPDDLVQLFSQTSPDKGEALNTPSTPQHQALIWLSGNVNYPYFSNEAKIQRYSLATFYFSTDGDKWNANNGWLSDADECSEWANVVCTSRGSVSELALSNNELEGTIPEELAMLSDSLGKVQT